MKMRNPTMRSSSVITQAGERPKGFSRCFHRKNDSCTSSGTHPIAASSRPSTSARSSSRQGRIVSVSWFLATVGEDRKVPAAGTIARPMAAKKAAALRMMKLAAAAADRLRPPPSGVVVLIYHRVGARTGVEVDLPASLFEEQVAALAESERVVTLDDA